MTNSFAAPYGAPIPGADEELIAGSPYLAYTYSYPHKTSYRPFEPPLDLADVWKDEDRSALFLYVHIPFCEMRCGFCNLFTYAKPEDSLAVRYLDALERQAIAVRDVLCDAQWSRLAIGGGTPTQLDERGLERLLEIVALMGCNVADVPTSVEMSPETLTPGKLDLLRASGVERASVGVQSFISEETKALRRPQQPAVAHRALEMMRAAGFPRVNVDLIYGIRGQTAASWEVSLAATLEHEPEEVFLYPLYVRPLTGLGNSSRQWDDERLDLYRRGRDRLLAAGYEQMSMRLFRRADAVAADGPAYRCQEDGMVGLGAGARSYTDRVHYCTEYAVGRRGVREIIDDFVGRSAAEDARVHYGTLLDASERRRRHVVLSLLSWEGLDRTYYRERFGTDPSEDFLVLDGLERLGLVAKEGGHLRLTKRGVERSDVVGPALYSDPVRQRMREYEIR